MTSTSIFPPTSVHDSEHNSGYDIATASTQQRPAKSSLDSAHLSPLLSRVNSDLTTPPTHHLGTPAGSTSTYSLYQPSDLSDFEEDPFFGADFANVDDVAPSFLDESSLWGLNNTDAHKIPQESHKTSVPYTNITNDATYPLTPDQTASIHTTSPPHTHQANISPAAQLHRLPDSISPQELQKPFRKGPLVIETSQFTPSHSSSGRSSEDGLAPATAAMHCPSPQVTVSVWERDGNTAGQPMQRGFDDDSNTIHGGLQSAGDLITSNSYSVEPSASRESLSQWQNGSPTGRTGLDPNNRPQDELATGSINEMANRRKVEERNVEVGQWLYENVDDLSVPPEKSPEEIRAIERSSQDQNDNIPFGEETQNKYIMGQIYYDPNGGQMNETDLNMISSSRWGDAPAFHPIRMGAAGRHQPQSSQAAIEKFEAMCRDTDSIVSRAATWGTRRRSLPSVMDMELEVTSGNLFKKLSISRSGERSNRSGSLLKNIQGLIRRPSNSQSSKRSRNDSDAYSPREEVPQGKRDSISRLAPPARPAGMRRKSTPNLDTAAALISVGHNVASIGATHARSGSISSQTPVTSPKSPRSSLSVRNPLRRPRSKSDLPAPTSSGTAQESHPNLINLLRKSGGPPVSSFAKQSIEHDDDDEDDDENFEDNDMGTSANLIDSVTPNFSGFHQHVIDLNPYLVGRADYLVDRLAHQQVVRYKQLLSQKVNHLKMGANCPCGSLCIALGGSAIIPNQKNDGSAKDPITGSYDDDDDDHTPTEGAISKESFPPDIPMPPTQQLPAEFECQLCYARKKLQKPSDWTKHVHEDVQPFTCTWDKCKDPKAFKRKADWVRHENEGHRHLEWWTCDVDDCQHTCYRRDNFLQHLVREHSFPEPRVKTKAAVKRSGGGDPTWNKVEQCHVETKLRPQQEPCKFCGKEFPTWKKLTVHLAKHMEQISLPVLRLVAAKAKELDADTIISPVQDPPPRQAFPLPGEHIGGSIMYPGSAQQPPMRQSQEHVSYSGSTPMMYSVAPPEAQFQPNFYQGQYDNIGRSLEQSHMGNDMNRQGYMGARHSQDLSTSAGVYVHPQNTFMQLPQNDMGGFGHLNALGLQNMANNQMTPQVGGQMTGHLGYDVLMAPSGGNSSPFSGQGSVSPYAHSPHQNNGNQNHGWSDGRMSGFR